MTPPEHITMHEKEDRPKNKELLARVQNVLRQADNVLAMKGEGRPEDAQQTARTLADEVKELMGIHFKLGFHRTHAQLATLAARLYRIAGDPYEAAKMAQHIPEGDPLQATTDLSKISDLKHLLEPPF